ncbi:MAG: hypothetical protein AAF725_21590 [Acidobacteriota bacterium]
MSKPVSAPSRLASIALALFSTAVALAGAEVAIRGLDLLAPLRFAAGSEAAEVQESAGPREADRSASAWMVHPYRGLTPRPSSDPLPPDRSGRNVLGALSWQLDPRTDLDRDAYRVGVFGGSQARNVGLSGRRTLERAAARTIGDGRPVQVVNFAISGYKQPQQLALLLESQLLGVELDAVINIDGYNEAVLAVGNAKLGHHPIYPNLGTWRQALGSSTGALTPRQIELSAETLKLRRRAETWRQRCEGAWCSALQLARAMVGWRVLSLEKEAVARERLLREQPGAEVLFNLDAPCLDGGEADDQCLDLVLDVWARSSHQMRALAESRGAVYLHVLQPSQYVADSKILTEEELERAWDPSWGWSRIAAAVYPNLRARGAELAASGLPFYDTTMIYRDEARSVWQDTCCHTNSYGSQMLGAAIGERIGAALKRRLTGPEPMQQAAVPKREASAAGGSNAP